MDHCQGEKKGKKLEHMGKDYSDFKATLEVGNKKAIKGFFQNQNSSGFQFPCHEYMMIISKLSLKFQFSN